MEIPGRQKSKTAWTSWYHQLEKTSHQRIPGPQFLWPGRHRVLPPISYVIKLQVFYTHMSKHMRG